MATKKNQQQAVIGRNSRGDWVVTFGRFRASLRMTGDEADEWMETGKPVGMGSAPEVPERVALFAADVAKPPANCAKPFVDRVDPSYYVPLDGEETIRMIPARTKLVGSTRVTMAGILVCDSRRCRTGDGRNMRALVVLRPGSYDYDPRKDRRRYEDLPSTVIEDRDPAEILAGHEKWHRDNFPVSARVTLNRWIDRHAHLRFPEPTKNETNELKAQLATAKAERKADLVARRKTTRRITS